MHFPMVYNPSGHLLAVLDNADAIGYELQRNDLSTASFTLPADDPNRAHCQTGNLVRLPGDGGGTGVYRIAGQDGEETAQGGEITYSLEHVMATLLDDVLLGEHDLTGTPLTEAIQYILDRQTTKRWVLGRVEPEGTAAIKCENTPLLTALLQLGQGIPEEYTWEFDCGNHTAGPWTLNLLRAEESPGCGIHYGRSLTSIRKTVDASALITRLYALGAGTGEERTDIRPANGGLPYIDADTIGTWGVRCGVLTDTGLTDPAALLEKARRALEQYKNPYITYTATAVDLAAVTGDPWDTYRPGKMVRVMDEEHGVAFVSRIVTVRKTDVWDAASLEITIANAPRDALDSMTEMQEQAETLAEEQNETKTQVSGTQRDVTKMQESLHWMAGQIDETTGNLEGVSLRLDGIGKQIELQAGTISAQGELISGAQVNIDGLKKRVESIAGDIDQLTGDLTGARELIDGANQRITEQAGEISNQGELISGAQEKIDGINKDIEDIAGDVDQITGDLAGVRTDLDGANKKITEQAGQISNQGELIEGVELTLNGKEGEIGLIARMTGAETSIQQNKDAIALRAVKSDVDAQFQVQAGQISSKVSADGIASAINQTAQSVLIQASKIDLKGYVTADTLAADIADIKREYAGQLTTSHLYAEDGHFASVNVSGTLTADVIMGGSNVNLSIHYHNFTPNGDGTVTIGGPSATPGSFNIADTQFYKDGVSAAKTAGAKGVSLDHYTANYVPSVSPKSLTVNAFLTNDEHHSQVVDVTDVYLKGHTDGYTDGQTSVTLDDPVWRSSSTYSNQAVTVSASNGNSKTAYVYLTQGSWSNGSKRVYMRSDSSSGTIRAQISVDAPSVSYTWDDNAKNNAKGTVTVGITINGTHYTRTYPIYASWV